MRHTLDRLRALAATTALAAALVTVPAAAATAAATEAGFAPASHPLDWGHTGYNINGYNWGGYAATGSGFTSVSATWSEPNATCNSRNDLYAPWVGIDGYGTSTVEQTGVATDCSSGRAVYQAWYEMYPAAPVYLSTTSYPVAPGNSIHATVTYAGSSRYTLTLQNTSRGWTFTTTKTLNSARRRSAEVIIESPTGAYPNFGSITFTGATVNGATLGSFNPTALDPSANGVYEARTGALSGGTSFSMTYLHE
jgi:hypothetical protein